MWQDKRHRAQAFVCWLEILMGRFSTSAGNAKRYVSGQDAKVAWKNLGMWHHGIGSGWCGVCHVKPFSVFPTYCGNIPAHCYSFSLRRVVSVTAPEYVHMPRWSTWSIWSLTLSPPTHPFFRIQYITILKLHILTVLFYLDFKNSDKFSFKIILLFLWNWNLNA